ncbi:MAG: AMP-binding protein [Rhodothermales bacterium]|nr:AMP-binding protein [Rhodothermales bacterium]
MSMSRPNSDGQFPFNQNVAWHPNQKWIDESNLAAFMKREGIGSYDELLQKATDDIAWFWDAAIADLGIEFSRPYDQVVDLSDDLRFPKWCTGGQMNIVHNLLDKWQSGVDRDRTALRWESEDGRRGTFTYEELNREVCKCSNALRSLGLMPGDAVGLYMPMTPEIIVAFLAIIKIGGIILPLFSGYGPGAIATRLNDAGAKALFTSDGFYRRGKAVAMKQTADDALQSATSVAHVIVHRRVGLDDVPWTEGRDHWWHDLVPDQSDEAATERTSAEDVVMVIYTSGTTGRPKGAVHTHCGFPIKAAQDMRHSMDLKPEDVMYWMSDMGWMMGPWLVFGTLLNGASMVIYDGAPDFPEVDRLWQIVESHTVTHLGLSPVLVRALMVHGTGPLENHNISTLRAIGSTGSPWDPESWLWIFRHALEGKKPILNYSGGTEISGGILCGNFFKPLKPCSFSGPVVGMAADVVDENGQPVREAVGELVIRQPWIGMTRGFWNDRARYVETYWSTYPDVWLHGDFAAVDSDGLWYILGRSDDTIKVAGKRLGPAEVEAILNAHDTVAESAAIGVPDEIKGEALAAFCVLKSGTVPSEDLRSELTQMVTIALGKPLKPKHIKFCAALPKTRNAKVMRRLIRAAFLDETLGDTSSLEDPLTIDAIVNAT